MHKKLIILLSSFSILFFFTGCGGGDSNTNEDVTATSSSKILNPYQALVETSLVYRVKALRLFEEVEDKEPLSGADLDALHHLTLNQLSLKDDIAEMIEKYQYLTEDADGYSEKERMELLMSSLSAMLLRYDNYLIAYINYENNTKLRDLLNDEDSAYDIPENTLSDMTNTYNSIIHRDKVKEMITFYDENIQAHEAVNENFFLYLKMMIDQSPSYKLGFDNTTEYSLDNLDSLYHTTIDIGGNILFEATYTLSKALGNTAGLVETRKGLLYDDAEVAAHVRSVIKAGDILLEKTPFRLTDKLIPGHWGHAAVYIGTADELKGLGIWDHPVVKEFQQQILDNKLIDEALRDDVQLNTIEHFLNVDDLAIMHDHTESDEAKAERIILTLRQLGKEYDFNFDIETSDRIVCSELVYATSIMIDWETEELVGIHTISPDNVAVKSIEEFTMFDITLLYHDGEEIKTDNKEMMKTLLEDAEEEE